MLAFAAMLSLAACPMDVLYTRTVVVVVPTAVHASLGSYPQELRLLNEGPAIETGVFRLGTICATASGTDFAAQTKIKSLDVPEKAKLTAWLVAVDTSLECGALAKPVKLDDALRPEAGAPVGSATISSSGDEFRFEVLP